jgi:hypothetical protein
MSASTFYRPVESWWRDEMRTAGCSIRATERLTDTHRDTIMRLGVRVGEGCARLHDCSGEATLIQYRPGL